MLWRVQQTGVAVNLVEFATAATVVRGYTRVLYYSTVVAIAINNSNHTRDELKTQQLLWRRERGHLPGAAVETITHHTTLHPTPPNTKHQLTPAQANPAQPTNTTKTTTPPHIMKKSKTTTTPPHPTHLRRGLLRRSRVVSPGRYSLRLLMWRCLKLLLGLIKNRLRLLAVVSLGRGSRCLTVVGRLRGEFGSWSWTGNSRR